MYGCTTDRAFSKVWGVLAFRICRARVFFDTSLGISTVPVGKSSNGLSLACTSSPKRVRSGRFEADESTAATNVFKNSPAAADPSVAQTIGHRRHSSLGRDQTDSPILAASPKRTTHYSSILFKTINHPHIGENNMLAMWSNRFNGDAGAKGTMAFYGGPIPRFPVSVVVSVSCVLGTVMCGLDHADFRSGCRMSAGWYLK